MGRKTYEEIIGFGVDWPYSGINTYVVTTNGALTVSSPDTYLLTSDIKDFLTDVKQKTAKDIWLVGGGQLICTFINKGLLDRMIITVIPKIIGDGIPLFVKPLKESAWKLIESTSFDTGVINLTYDRAD